MDRSNYNCGFGAAEFMREIKFRALYKGFWYYQTLEEILTITLAAFRNGQHKTQFTGLKDKNKKEIWEGDIVRIHNYSTIWKYGEPAIDWKVFEVKYNQYLWAFNNEVIYMPISNYDITSGEPYRIEVIGNIYEHPHLLTA